MRNIERLNLEPLTVTVRTACKLTGLGPTKMYELMNRDEVRTTKVDGRRLIVYADLKSRFIPPPPPPEP